MSNSHPSSRTVVFTAIEKRLWLRALRHAKQSPEAHGNRLEHAFDTPRDWQFVTHILDQYRQKQKLFIALHFLIGVHLVLGLIGFSLRQLDLGIALLAGSLLALGVPAACLWLYLVVWSCDNVPLRRLLGQLGHEAGDTEARWYGDTNR